MQDSVIHNKRKGSSSPLHKLDYNSSRFACLNVSKYVKKEKFLDNIFAENEQHSRERRADAAVGVGDVEQVQLHDGRAQRSQVTFQGRSRMLPMQRHNKRKKLDLIFPKERMHGL